MARLWCILCAVFSLGLLAPQPAASQELAKQVAALPYTQRPCSSANKQTCKAANKDRVPIRREDREWAASQRKQCDRGAIASCRALGEAYLLGVGVRSNRPVAQALFEQGCDGGDGAACAMLADLRATEFGRDGPVSGNVIINPSPRPEDDTAAAIARTYDRGCKLGYLPACESYADTLFAGTGVTADPQAAQVLLDETCARGLEEACSNLADRLIYGGSQAADTDRAIMLLDAQCRRGYASGCDRAARFLFDRPGQGSLRIGFLEMGCAQSSADSCYELGVARFDRDRAGDRHVLCHGARLEPECRRLRNNL